MQFELDEDRSLLKQQTRELLERESGMEAARAVMEDVPEGYDKALHATLGELGYLALALPEADGGMGATALAAVLHEMGRCAFPGPYLDTLIAARVLNDAPGGSAQAVRDRVISGEALGVLARAERLDDLTEAECTTRFSDGRIDGTKRMVPFGAHADFVVVDAVEGLVLCHRPESGWDAAAMPTLDHAQRFCELRLTGAAELIAPREAADSILAVADRLGTLGAAAGLLGLAERALEMTVAYTAEREAFGAPIGSFQSLQHRCADMLLQVESARSAVYRAAWAVEQEPETAAELVAVAKAWAGPAARSVCGEAIQLHGGVGFTWEYDPHLFFKRANTLGQLHGSTRSQLDRVLEARGL